MNSPLDHTAQLVDELDLTLPMSLTAISDVYQSDGDIQFINDLFDPTTMFPSSIDMLCLDMSMSSVFDFDTMPTAGNFDASSPCKADEDAWHDNDVSELVFENATPVIDSSELFMHAIMSAIEQDDGPITAESSVSNTEFAANHPEASPSVPFSTLDSEPVHTVHATTDDSYAATSPLPAVCGDLVFSPASSPCYPRDSDPDGDIQPSYDTPTADSADYAAFSPVPALQYPCSEGVRRSASPSPSLSSVSHSSFSPVPSLCYPDPSVAGSPPPSGTFEYQASYTGHSPSPPAVEESILSRASRAAGITVVPSRPTKRSKAQHAPYPPSFSQALSRSHHNPPARKRRSSSSREACDAQSPKPRNVQSPLDPARTAFTYTKGAFRCPVPKCKYRPPSSRRKSDIRRHLESHCSKQNQQRWVCCGVPVGRAGEYGITDVSDAYMWRGWRMVGGCNKGFSRRDSLQRHLRSSVGCRGCVDMADMITELNDKALAEVAGY